MSGQRGSETRIRTIAHATRWSPAEFQLLCDLAKHNDCSRAQVLRCLVADKYGNILPSRQLTSEVLRIGHNINQLARAANKGELIPSSALDDVYEALLAAVIAIRA